LDYLMESWRLYYGNINQSIFLNPKKQKIKNLNTWFKLAAIKGLWGESR
jgi:hypothetical protein